MAGHRRRHRPGQPLQRVRNVEKRRSEYTQALAGQTSERKRVSAACDYVRSALAYLAKRDPTEADAMARELRAELEDVAERVFRRVLSTSAATNEREWGDG